MVASGGGVHALVLVREAAWIDGQGLVVSGADEFAVADVLRPGAAGEGDVGAAVEGLVRRTSPRGVQLPLAPSVAEPPWTSTALPLSRSTRAYQAFVSTVAA